MGRSVTEFKSTCECGEAKTVFEWDAGTDWTCSCGRVVIVPALGKLRQSIGLAEVPRSPAEIVRAKVSDGSLPVHGCLLCASENAETIPLIANCERATRHRNSAGDQADSTLMFAALAGAGLGVLIGAILSPLQKQNITFLGRNVVVDVPIQVCESCRPTLRASRGIKVAQALKYLAGLIGMVLLFIPGWRSYGAVSLLICFGLHCSAVILRFAHFRGLRQKVSRVPEYQQLFLQYPRAIVVEPASGFPQDDTGPQSSSGW